MSTYISELDADKLTPESIPEQHIQDVEDSRTAHVPFLVDISTGIPSDQWDWSAAERPNERRTPRSWIDFLPFVKLATSA
jgi:hypothetical protein